MNNPRWHHPANRRRYGRTRRPRRWTGLALAAVVGPLLSIPAPASADVHTEILGLGRPDAVDNSYVVVFHGDARSGADTASLTRRLAAEHGVTLEHQYSAAVHGFAGTMTEAAARKIAADPAVDFVEQNALVRAAGTQSPTPSWGLDRIDQLNLPLDNSFTFANTASNVTAYIIDSGIRVTHNDFAGRAVWGTNTTGDGNNTDCSGHGTHVAGTVGGTSFGVAKGVRLVAVKVLNCAGSGTFAGVIAGVDWVTGQHQSGAPAVANVSIGAQGANLALENAVRNSIADGVVYAVAGGTSSINPCDISPARVTQAITVGATTRADQISATSGVGPCVDLYAPGEGISSTWHTNDMASNMMSGTSTATAHVSGVAALYLSDNPSATPATISRELVTSGIPRDIIDFTPRWWQLYISNQFRFCPGLTNTTDVAIEDLQTVESTIGIQPCFGWYGVVGWAEVHIQHTDISDLIVDLISPRRSVFNLHNRTGKGVDNIDRTYFVDLLDEPYDGVWVLRVHDIAEGDTGIIDSWTVSP